MLNQMFFITALLLIQNFNAVRPTPMNGTERYLAQCYYDYQGYAHCENFSDGECLCRVDEFLYCCGGRDKYCTCCPYWFSQNNPNHNCEKDCYALYVYKKEWSDTAKSSVKGLE
ncbi:unnamed protein product [Orchesella dallaii]|uniref:Uncharacterized protein n=1 Tax=Orchesella dallaii TaxID=48710 RepID=A0ABP1RT61_9HEXA